jgi:hypothetical protein
MLQEEFAKRCRHSLIEENAPQRRRLRDLDAAGGVFQDRFDLIPGYAGEPREKLLYGCAGLKIFE